MHLDLFLALKAHDKSSLLLKYKYACCSKQNVAKLQLAVFEMTQTNQSMAPLQQQPEIQPITGINIMPSQSPATNRIPNSSPTTVSILLQAEKERKLREEKSMNFAISGILESDKESDDEKVVWLVSGNDLGAQLQLTDILEIARLGRPLSDSDNVQGQRRLLVKLRKDCEETRRKQSKILKGAPNLRRSTDNHVRQYVYVNPDLTPMQRTEQAARRHAKRSQSSDNQPDAGSLVAGQRYSSPRRQ
jgi:hypothetical protein